ncbi:MAG: SRPBCC family protein [Ignavibacteria bacterium]|nr:SRPBCC family protein [Ignavibacteria bacterium]
MPFKAKVNAETIIDAPIERCFLLSLSVDLHVLSAKATKEKAVAGKTSGILELGDSVTWLAKHFGIFQKLTSMIVKYQYPDYFWDEMMKGPFKTFRHEHYFEFNSGKTVMKDVIDFESPGSVFGKMVNKVFLEKYLENFLEKRNKAIKMFAETDRWKSILQEGEN